MQEHGEEGGRSMSHVTWSMRFGSKAASQICPREVRRIGAQQTGWLLDDSEAALMAA